jgi:iron complex outermembrane recepter protein
MARDLGDLLDRVAGVHVHRYGGFGAFSVASVRGSSAGQVLICVDGVPVSSAGEGFVNLALLPLSSLDHAEIYRGPQTQAFAGPPAAGVINLVTHPALPAPLRLSVGLGSFGAGTARGQWGGRYRLLSAFVSSEVRHSRGDFPYLNRNGTDYGNTADDRVVRRTNNDFTDAAFLIKGAVRSPHADSRGIDYTMQRSHRRSGVPGTENSQTRHVRFRSEKTRHELAMHGRPFLGLVSSSEGGHFVSARTIDLKGSLHSEQSLDRYENRDGEVGLGRAATEDRIWERGGQLKGSILLVPLRQKMAASLEARKERFIPRDLLRGLSGFARTRDHRTILVEDRLVLARLTLEGNYRWARATDNYAGPVVWGRPPAPSPPRHLSQEGPTFGIRLDAGRGVALKANRGRVTRFPSFSELFGQNGIQDGNPALRPERGIQWDAGVTLAHDPVARAWSFPHSLPLRLEAAYFESLIDDRISLLQNSQRTTKAQNLDRSWTRGVEASAFTTLSLPWRASLELQGDYTWQEAKDRGRSPTYRGKDLPNLPRHEEYISFLCDRGVWGLRWEVSARSAAYRDRYNSPEKRTSAYTVHDLTLSKTLKKGAWRIQAAARNVGDKRVEDIDGFPLPGRSFLTEVTWTR